MNRSGFTVIELLIVVAIVAILGIVGFGVVAGGSFSGGVQANAANGMKMYVSQMYPELTEVRIQCMGTDSDMNGYVRCTATGKYPTEDGDIKRETVTAECASGWGFTEGCGPVKDNSRRY